MAPTKAFVSDFVELSRAGRANEMIGDLSKTLMGLGNSRCLEVSPQGATAPGLKPDKAFRVATALMANNEAVTGLLNLLLQCANLPRENLVLLGLFVKLTSIPTFAEKFGTCSAAASFIRFQQPFLSRIYECGSWTSELHTESSAFSLIGAADRYLRTVCQLVLDSPAFLQEARSVRLVDMIFGFFPWPSQPFLSWAHEKDLTAVAVLAQKQFELARDFFGGAVQYWSFQESEVLLLGDWIDRFLDFAVALEEHWTQAGMEGKGHELTAKALNFARVIMTTDDVRGVFFTAIRLEKLLKHARELTRLGGNRGSLAAEMAHAFEQIGVQIGGDGASGSSVGKEHADTKVSLQNAEACLRDLRRTRSDAATCRALDGLLGEVRKGGWTEAHTRKLASKECFHLLLRVLEKDLPETRKVGREPATCAGPVWPAINVMQHLVVTSFRDPDAHGDKAFLSEQGEVAPRILAILERCMNAFPEVELASLLETLLVSFDMNLEGKWANLWRIVEVMLKSQGRYVPGQVVPMLVWDCFFDYRSYLPELSQEARDLMTSLRARPFATKEGRNRAWKQVLVIAKRDEEEGGVAWSEEAKQRKIATACADVLSSMQDRIGGPNSPVPNAAAILRFCCRFPSVVKDEVRPEVGTLTASLKSSYAMMAAPFYKSTDAQRALLFDVSASSTWHQYERIVSQLSHCMLAVLAVEPLEGSLLDEIARNGGADFAAEVLKTRKLAEKFIARNDRED